MEPNSFHEILQAFGLNAADYCIELYGTGHIHTTYRVRTQGKANDNWIIQKLNTVVFKQPESIMLNWQKALDLLNAENSADLLVSFRQTTAGLPLFFDKQGNPWRMMPFVEESIAYESFGTTAQVAGAAGAFGRLGRLLAACDPAGFGETIPGFFDIRLRFEQFRGAKQTAEIKRLQQAKNLIAKLENFASIVDQYNQILNNKTIPLRIVHGDCKPSNVLFNKYKNNVKAIADPDTLMPGYFFYDLGDMVRSMACTSAEDEPEAENVIFRRDFYEAIMQGYLTGMGDKLNRHEKQLIPFAGKYMLYMQALRFMADFLQNDVYYPVQYATHNLVRARNQLLLLEELSKIKA